MALGRLVLGWRNTAHTQKGLVAMAGSAVHGGVFINPTLSTGGFVRCEFAGIVYGTCVQCPAVNATVWKKANGTGTFTLDFQSSACATTLSTIPQPTIQFYLTSGCVTPVVGSPSTTNANFTTIPTPANETDIIIIVSESVSASQNHIAFQAQIPACDFVEGAVFDNEVAAHGCFTAYNGVNFVAVGRGGTVTISRVCL